VASLKIEKFVGETHETTIKIPLLVLHVATKLLPKMAFAALDAKGINLKEILEAKTNGATYSKTINVCEHKINKRVVMSIL
jgi:hypothetical protein